MRCPSCGNISSPKRVIRTYLVKGGMLKRKRQCTHCKENYFTIERYADEEKSEHKQANPNPV